MYEYEDMFTEPSDAERIIGEAQDQLTELLNCELKEHFNKYVKANEKLGVIEKTIRQKKQEINHLQKQIDELNAQLENANKYDMPRKYIDMFVRDITGYFAPGDKAWHIKNHVSFIRCTLCGGGKAVMATIAGERVNIKCPKCNGSGNNRIVERRVEERMIEGVDLRLCFERDRVGVWTTDSIKLAGEDYSVKADCLFRTREEAEKQLQGE